MNFILETPPFLPFRMDQFPLTLPNLDEYPTDELTVIHLRVICDLEIPTLGTESGTPSLCSRKVMSACPPAFTYAILRHAVPVWLERH